MAFSFQVLLISFIPPFGSSRNMPRMFPVGVQPSPGPIWPKMLAPDSFCEALSKLTPLNLPYLQCSDPWRECLDVCWWRTWPLQHPCHLRLWAPPGQWKWKEMTCMSLQSVQRLGGMEPIVGCLRRDIGRFLNVVLRACPF